MNNIKPASRLDAVQEYYFSRKLKEVARLNAEGQDIISLAIGSPDQPPSPQTIDKLCEVAHDPSAHGYQPTMGTMELRKAMADFYHRWYGVEIDADSEVQPLIGSKEGILHITLAFVNPGDEVLVPNPGYPTYTSLSKILGAKVVNYNLDEDNGWQPDFEELEHRDLSRVKLMWTNYPNMPTGGNARRETYERLVDFAKKHHIVVVNDNPYSFILNEEHLIGLHKIVVDHLCSKEFAQRGIGRITWIGYEDFIARIDEGERHMENALFRTDEWQYFSLRIELHSIPSIIESCHRLS